MIEMLPRRIAVSPIFDSNTSPTGLIIIPDEAKERCDQGIVKHVGEDCSEISVGDYVLFSGYTGTLVYVEGEGTVIIMHKDFVIGKLHPPNTQVPGLYYRDKKGWGDLALEIASLLTLKNGSSRNVEDIMNLVSKYNPYFSADYEAAVGLISQAYQDHSFKKNSKIVHKYEDRLKNGVN